MSKTVRTTTDRQAAFTGTKDVAAPLRFDPARLEAYLRANVAGFAGPLSVRQFKGGQSNPTYLAGQRRRAATCCAASRRASSCRRRTRSIASSASSARCHAQGFPVAEPVLYCADESVAGTAFYVMGFVEGRVFWNPDMPGSNPAERAAVYDAMNATLARLHSFDPAAIGLADFGRGENYVAPPGRALVEAVPRLGDAEDRRDGTADRMAAGASAAGRARAPGARRLPARQHDPAAPPRRRCSRCSTGNSRRSAIRSPISPII